MSPNPETSSRSRSVGRLSRLGIGAQVFVTGLLAVAAVLLVNWLVARPGVRMRFDLTAAGNNTLATATLGVLERLEDEVTIDILYRPEERPLTALAEEVMLRVDKLLALLEEESGGKLDIRRVDTSDPEAWAIRKAELRLPGYQNGLVLSQGKQRSFLPLVGILADFDLGNPVPDRYVPPRVRQFLAESAIVEGLLDVTRGDQLQAYFTFGYGEPNALDSEENEGLGLIVDDLEADGFRAHRWNMLEDGPLPDDCDVLVVVGPKKGYPDEMYDEIVRYVERGGRMLIAPSTLGEDLRRSDVPDLLEHFGIEVSDGRAMKPAVDQRTNTVVEGVFECELHYVTVREMSQHPMLSGFRAGSGVFAMPFAHQVRVKVQPPDGVAQNLFRTTSEAWIDSVPCDRRHDPRTDGLFDAFPLAVALRRAPMQEVPMARGLEEEPEVRVVALGSEFIFSNAATQNGQLGTPDLLRAAFQWATDQEHRIRVPQRDPDMRFLRSDDPGAYVTVTRFAQFYLPGAALLAGVLVWFLRSRGTRRARAASTPPSA